MSQLAVIEFFTGLWGKTHVLMWVPFLAALLLGRRLGVYWAYLLIFLAVWAFRAAWLNGSIVEAWDRWADEQKKEPWLCHAAWGTGEILVIVSLASYAVAQRWLEQPTMVTELSFGGGGAFVTAFICWRLWDQKDPNRLSPLVTTRVVAEPFVIAWFVVSAIHGGVALFITGQSSTAIQERAQAGQAGVGQRQEVQQQRGTLGPVAVTLSGGGYRAAVTEAGALWVLDRVGVPIDLLSTVSGGSIIGANYAAGVSPERFIRGLCEWKPDLPMLLMNMFSVVPGIIARNLNSGDVYAWHFSTTYFHGATLAGTGPPTLILNATRYDTGTRAAFWPARSGGLTLARGVAASGAFPGAFDPVHIDHAVAAKAKPGEPEAAEGFFIDGGTDENLGVDGLYAYLKETRSAAIPDVLLIVDMSKDPALGRGTRKPSQLTAVFSGSDIAFRSLHLRIFDALTDGAYSALLSATTDPNARDEDRMLRVARWRPPKDRVWTFSAGQDGRGNGVVSVVIVRPTAPEERAWYESKGSKEWNPDLAKRLQNVGKLDTLSELEPPQITDAVWFGAKAMVRRLPELRESVEAVQNRPTGLRLKPAPDLTTTPACPNTKRPGEP